MITFWVTVSAVAYSSCFCYGIWVLIAKWRMWSRTRVTHREFRRLVRKYHGAELACDREWLRWLDGGRSVIGLEDLRESADEFREAIGMLGRRALDD